MKPKKIPFSQEELNGMLRYEPDTGKLFWKIKNTGGKNIGDEAGCVETAGYITIGIKGGKYKASRIIWIMLHGEIPVDKQIDHEDRDRTNNREYNLRLATNQQNTFNRKGVKGYTWCREQNKWRAQIYINGKTKHLGRFDDEEEARSAYLEAKKVLHIM